MTWIHGINTPLLANRPEDPCLDCGGPDYQTCGCPMGYEKESKVYGVTHIDVDSGEEITVGHSTWREADDQVKLYGRNAIPAWHVED